MVVSIKALQTAGPFRVRGLLHMTEAYLGHQISA
jgi:hypothetical protein